MLFDWITSPIDCLDSMVGPGSRLRTMLELTSTTVLTTKHCARALLTIHTLYQLQTLVIYQVVRALVNYSNPEPTMVMTVAICHQIQDPQEDNKCNSSFMTCHKYLHAHIQNNQHS
jgi:hypothetical protein